jgi:hypothetical protein
MKKTTVELRHISLPNFPFLGLSAPKKACKGGCDSSCQLKRLVRAPFSAQLQQMPKITTSRFKPPIIVIMCRINASHHVKSLQSTLFHFVSSFFVPSLGHTP